MDWQTLHQQTLTFLHTEKQALQHKIAYQRTPRHNGADDCCAAEWELDVLEAVLTAQQNPRAVSLESTLVCMEADLQRRLGVVSWRHGEASPPDYWRLECQRSYLADLLNRYHLIKRNHH